MYTSLIYGPPFLSFASFLVLFLGVIVTYLLARPVLVGFAAGEIIGFFLCWLAVAIALMLKKD